AVAPARRRALGARPGPAAHSRRARGAPRPDARHGHGRVVPAVRAGAAARGLARPRRGPRMMEPLGPEVRRELGRFGPQAGLGKLVAAWPAAVGAQIAANAWPARFRRDGILVVHTSSSAWAFELAQL